MTFLRCLKDDKCVEGISSNKNNKLEEGSFSFALIEEKTFKAKSQSKGKRVISVLYNNVTQMQNEDTDYGDLPRSKKQLIDLSRSSLLDNEVGDILAYNEELNNDAIV